MVSPLFFYQLALIALVWLFVMLLYIPTTILLEHALRAQGFMGVQKASFPRCLRPQNRDFTCANLVEALK